MRSCVMVPPRRDISQIEAAQRFAVEAEHGAELDVEIDVLGACFCLPVGPAIDDLTNTRPS